MRYFPVLLAVLLAGCASTEKAAISAERPAFFSSEAPDPAPLSQIDIPAGQCGMILWARSGGRAVPIFRSVDVVDAAMTVEGEQVPLRLASQDGDMRLGMRARQLFTSVGDVQPGLTVEASLEWGQPFPSGSYIRGGTLTLTGADGWQRVLPVAGIAGCKA